MQMSQFRENWRNVVCRQKLLRDKAAALGWPLEKVHWSIDYSSSKAREGSYCPVVTMCLDD